MKLRKLKTTIISSVTLLFSLFCYAAHTSIAEQGSYYLIATEVDIINRTQDIKRATLKAKSQLARYLQPKSKIVTIELKHFQYISKTVNSDKVIYRFKVNKENVKIVE